MNTQELISALEAAGIDWTDYSGRGMFGERCIAVACGGDTRPSEGEVLEAVRNVKGGLRVSRDSLGKGTVVYWPSAKLEEE